MVATPIASHSFIGSYPSLPIASGGADLTWTAADVPNGNSTPLTDSKTVLLALNSDGATTHHVTISSAPDTLNRLGDITGYAVAAGKVSAFGPFRTAGWASGSNLMFSADNAAIEFAVIQLP